MSHDEHTVRAGRLAVAVVPAATLPFLASLFYFVVFAHSGFARALYGATKVFTLVWPALATTLILKEALPRPRWRGGTHLRAIPLGMVVGLVIATGILLLARGPLAPLMVTAAPRIREKVTGFGIEEHFVAFALLLSIVHSLLEEYAWRWFVYGQLAKRFSRVTAHGVAAVAFAAHHVVVTSQFFGLAWAGAMGAAVGAGGALFSWLYQRQGTLAGAWAAHTMADLAIMAVGYQLLFRG